MLLRSLAVTRTATAAFDVRYDKQARVSHVRENGAWVPSYDSVEVPKTKKADLETGEDQKGQ